MIMWITIAVLPVIAFFIILTLLQRRCRDSGMVSAGNDRPFSREGTVAFSTDDTKASTGLMPEEMWWKNISSLHRQQLALHLAGKAMPVWEKFTSSQVVSYRDASAGPLIIIENDLLQRTLEAMFLHVQLPFPKGDSIKIHQYHQRFIGLILALKDGKWVCSYPVKKIFLSVYFILVSIVEQHNPNTNEHFISEAINAALECMELSKLYTPEEIASVLEAYRHRLTCS